LAENEDEGAPVEEEDAVDDPGTEAPSALTPEDAEAMAEELLGSLRAIELAQFLVSTVSTLASIAYGKLGDGKLEEARLGIDALRALVPVLADHVDDSLRRSLEQALANLQVAYADAVARA
jgi:Domain of unknown function (DUF1844)